MMVDKNFKKASVLAFEKKLVVSDGYMYGTTWENRDHDASPIKLVEKSVRGTISNRLKKAVKNDPAKLNAQVEKPNLQTVDSASLALDQDTLKLVFTVKVLSGVQRPSACNSASHYEGIRSMGTEFIKEQGFKELAHRYAYNLANGRFLWRNRVGAEALEIRVHIAEYNKNWVFDGYRYSLKDFDEEASSVDELAALIADTLSGEKMSLLIEVEAFAKVGKGQEVYPSEELILDKGKGKKSKVLYQVNGIAAMHSQKLGNAIRTIDTWYPEYDGKRNGPIAVEPYGAVTNLGIAYRPPKEKKDFYTLFDAWSEGNKPDSVDDQNYVMAVLVRGGVFGEGDND